MDVKTAYRAGLIQGYKKEDQTMEIYKTIANALQESIREQPPEPYRLSLSYGDAQHGGQFAFSATISSPASRGEPIWRQDDISDEDWAKMGEIIEDLKSEWPKVVNSMGLALNEIIGKNTEVYMECSFPYRLKDIKKIRSDLIQSIPPVSGVGVEINNDTTDIVQIAIASTYASSFADQVHDEAVAWFERNMFIISDDSGVEEVTMKEDDLEDWMRRNKRELANLAGTKYEMYLITFTVTQ